MGISRLAVAAAEHSPRPLLSGCTSGQPEATGARCLCIASSGSSSLRGVFRSGGPSDYRDQSVFKVPQNREQRSPLCRDYAGQEGGLQGLTSTTLPILRSLLDPG